MQLLCLFGCLGRVGGGWIGRAVEEIRDVHGRAGEFVEDVFRGERKRVNFENDAQLNICIAYLPAPWSVGREKPKMSKAQTRPVQEGDCRERGQGGLARQRERWRGLTVYGWIWSDL